RLVLVRLCRLHGLGADLRGRLGGDDGAGDQALDAVAGDDLVPDGVVPVVVDLELGGVGVDDVGGVGVPLPVDHDVVTHGVRRLAGREGQAEGEREQGAR